MSPFCPGVGRGKYLPYLLPFIILYMFFFVNKHLNRFGQIIDIEQIFDSCCGWCMMMA